MKIQMLDSSSIISIFLISGLILYILTKNYLSKDRSDLWSPMTFIALIFTYYTLIPLISIINGETYYLGLNMSRGISYSYLGSCISLYSIYFGFKIFKTNRKIELGDYINTDNALKIGLFLYGLALVGYVPFRGFQLNITQADETISFSETGGFDQYFIQFVSFLVMSVILFIPHLKNNKKSRLFLMSLISIAFVIYIVGGFRFRLVILISALATVYYLYSQKRLKILVWIPIIILFVYFMGIMQNTRNYSKGLDLTKIEGFSKRDILLSGTEEASGVFLFSGVLIKEYSRREKKYFEPLLNALFMPVPRILFPKKPDADYLRETNTIVLGTTAYGAAYTNYTESFIAFGWFGIIFNGLLIGFISKIFWINFKRNQNSFGAIILLALYNGFSYVLISRGYLAQELTLFFFFILIPALFGKIFNRYFLH